jgi:restriction system protein
MDIWRYDENLLGTTGPSAVEWAYGEVHSTNDCRFCHEPLAKLVFQDHTPNYRDLLTRSSLSEDTQRASTDFTIKEDRRLEHHVTVERVVKTCPICGWWVAFRDDVVGSREIHSYGGVGALKILAGKDIQAPIEEVRAFLTANYKSRFAIHPKIFEETVASVFRDLGYSARVTAYSGDDGIDVILDRGPETVGVQVKRYRDTIQVSQIRELVGALVINKITKGIFVTTSDYTSGAERTANLAAENGFAIELYNADHFYEALKLAQRAKYSDPSDPDASFNRVHWSLLHVNRPGRGRIDY